MAAPINDGKTKRPRDRKNPGAREFFEKKRLADNAKRPKQRFSNGANPDGTTGSWTRKAA